MFMKRCIVVVVVLLGVGGIFLWAKELIHLDVRSVGVEAESLPIEFLDYPLEFTPEVKQPEGKDVELNILEISHYEFLNNFAREELEEGVNGDNKE